MLHIAETFTLAGAEAEIKFFHVFVVAELWGLAFHHHTAVFEYVAVVGIA
jgi:hypothetical protein